MNRLTWLVLTGLTVMLTPLVYSFGASATSFMLTAFRLAQWNPNNWIGVLVGVLVAALFVRQLAQASQSFGLRTPRKKRSWRALLPKPQSLGDACGFHPGCGRDELCLLPFYSWYHSQLAFLFSVMTAGVASTGVNSCQTNSVG